MHLVEVIPITRGISRETLSYFSSGALAAGSLVTVPVRKRLVSAIVVSSRDAHGEKTSIKSFGYSMKKVGAFKSENFLSEPYMKAARAVADFSASSVGAVLSVLVPRSVLNHWRQVKTPRRTGREPDLFDRLALQDGDQERLTAYRVLIREEFARKRSVFFCLPTAEAVKRFGPPLSKGIEDRSYSFFGSVTPKKMLAKWRRALSEEHPILIVATAPFFALCRPDVGAIVIENESSRSYKLPVRPFVDVRVFAEFLAKESGVKFIVGDVSLRVETLFRLNQGEFAEAGPLKFRIFTPAESAGVDMSGYKKSAGGKFEVLSSELEELIKKSSAGNERMFIFASRRGFASETVCGDCGALVLCPRCHSPITLHLGRVVGGQNFFFCHACGQRRSAEERCAECRSWKLRPLGVGIELVEAEIRKKFPSAKIFRIDKDAAPTGERAGKEAAAFYAWPGGLLLGTEMALSYLDGKIENTAVASLDSLFSLPDFRIHERIFHILLKIRSVTGRIFLVQTRTPDAPVLDFASKGNLIGFYRDEIAARETFHYPPFTTLIKITLRGTRPTVSREMEKLPEFFKPFETELFPAFTEEARGKFTMHALIRLPRATWIDKTLLAKLLSLSPQFSVDVEPESLL